MNYKEYRIKQIGTRKGKKHAVNNSYGTKDIYRYCRKKKLIDGNITEKDFRKIINALNLTLQDTLFEKRCVKFPERMGAVEIKKFKGKVKIEDNKIITNYPINWKKTLQLWYTDKEAESKKTLIREEAQDIYKFIYNKSNAVYKNKTFYKFTPTRYLKLKLKEIINTQGYDAFLF